MEKVINKLTLVLIIFIIGMFLSCTAKSSEIDRVIEQIETVHVDRFGMVLQHTHSGFGDALHKTGWYYILLDHNNRLPKWKANRFIKLMNSLKWAGGFRRHPLFNQIASRDQLIPIIHALYLIEQRYYNIGARALLVYIHNLLFDNQLQNGTFTEIWSPFHTCFLFKALDKNCLDFTKYLYAWQLVWVTNLPKNNTSSKVTFLNMLKIYNNDSFKIEYAKRIDLNYAWNFYWTWGGQFPEGNPPFPKLSGDINAWLLAPLN